MKQWLIVLCLIFLLSKTQARDVAYWPYPKLVDNSDAVAVVEVSSIENTNDALEGHGDSKRYQSHIAHLNVAWIIKGDQKVKKLDVVFFTYSEPSAIADDGALFIDFRGKEKYQYLVFLKKVEKDRYEPTTGHYDASISVKQIKNDHFTGPINK